MADSPTLRLARQSRRALAVMDDRGDWSACVWGWDHPRAEARLRAWALVTIEDRPRFLRRTVPLCAAHLTELKEAGRVVAVAPADGPVFGAEAPDTLF